MGWSGCAVSILWQLSGPGIGVAVELDGVRRARRGVRTLVIGDVGTVRGGIELLPEARADDGPLDVVLLAPRGFPGRLPVAARLAARAGGSTIAVERFQARHVVVRTQRPVRREVDGEILPRARVLDIAVDLGALLVRVPRPGG